MMSPMMFVMVKMMAPVERAKHKMDPKFVTKWIQKKNVMMAEMLL